MKTSTCKRRTWLTSRELADAAGPWDTRLMSDDDGEYYCRVLLASEGTRFVPESKVFYRVTSSSRWSYVGTSDKKKNALLLSMKLHVKYLRSLEESDRVRNACLIYMQNWFENFYPDRPDIMAELQSLAAELHGHLETPRLRWKYAWMEPIFGRSTAKRAQMVLPQMKASLVRAWDKAMYRLETREAASALTPKQSASLERIRAEDYEHGKSNSTSRQDPGHLERAPGDGQGSSDARLSRFQRR